MEFHLANKKLNLPFREMKILLVKNKIGIGPRKAIVPNSIRVVVRSGEVMRITAIE